MDYLESRRIDIEIAKQYCKEIYFKNTENNKNYFAISFTNDSRAYEWRNKYSKGILGGSKDITSIYNHLEESEKLKTSRLCVFEGFMDFLSYLTGKKTQIEQSNIKNSQSEQNLLNMQNPVSEDYIILNSVALVHKFISNMSLQLDVNSNKNNEIEQSNFKRHEVSVYGNTHKVEKYTNIDLYLDNDRAGDEATQKILAELSDHNILITDKRNLYSGYKDYNEYLCSQ